MPSIPDRLGSQNIVRVLSNATSPPVKLVSLSDVNSVDRTDGNILVWNASDQTFYLSNTIDAENLSIGSSSITGTIFFTNTTDNILGNPDTGSVQIDGGVGIDKNVTIGAGLSVSTSGSFNSLLIRNSDLDNTLGIPSTGALQVAGGAGISKNLTVGQNLYVQGISTFIGSATFKGGTIGIGDSTSDDINVGGEFVSSLVPNDDNTYDIGISTQRWRNGYFAGILTASQVYYGVDSYEPNAVAYFNPDGQLSSASTTTTIDTSNYILTTYETAGIGTPVWATIIDGGEY